MLWVNAATWLVVLVCPLAVEDPDQRTDKIRSVITLRCTRPPPNGLALKSGQEKNHESSGLKLYHGFPATVNFIVGVGHGWRMHCPVGMRLVGGIAAPPGICQGKHPPRSLTIAILGYGHDYNDDQKDAGCGQPVNQTLANFFARRVTFDLL